MFNSLDCRTSCSVTGSEEPSFGPDSWQKRQPSSTASNPFEHHQVIHLGLVDPEAPWPPSSSGLVSRASRLSLASSRGSRGGRPSATDFVQWCCLEELDRLAEATEHSALLHPDVLLRLHTDLLQSELELVVGLRKR